MNSGLVGLTEYYNVLYFSKRSKKMIKAIKIMIFVGFVIFCDIYRQSLEIQRA